jgi:hypothetical protein
LNIGKNDAGKYVLFSKPNSLKELNTLDFMTSVKILNNNLNYSTIITNFDVENLDKHVASKAQNLIVH